MTGRLSDQHRLMLVDVLHELNRINIPEFDYFTRVYRGEHHYYLEELVPRIEKRRFRKDKAVNLGRVAIKLDGYSNSFTVHQPRWLVPLQEELVAIEALLPRIPEIATDYVAVWRDETYRDFTYSGGLVPEVKADLSEARRQYWIARVDELSAMEQPELPQSRDQAGLESK